MTERDQNKRLGALRDSEEVKQHVFFKGIDWDAVYRRELKPPLPKIQEIPSSRIPHERIFSESVGFEARVKNWTFVAD